MINVLLNSKSKKELTFLEEYTRHLSARISEEIWQYYAFSGYAELTRFLDGMPLIDLACLDLTLEGSLDGAKEVRRLNGKTYILVIADNTVSPMSYICPDVMATSLILRPFNAEQLKGVVYKMIKSYFKEHFEKENNEDVFVIDAKDGKQLLPYDRICCFEARDKKIFAVSESVEYSFYDTIENLESILPGQFVRCHRGFIVNTDRIDRIQLSQNLILLDDETEVPLSRSYKSALKGRFGSKKGGAI